VRAVLDGDALHGAMRSLTETLAAGPSAEVAAFNRRLRDHFDGFIIDPDGGAPVPLWKVPVPAHIEQPTAPVGEALSGYIARRADELNLSRTSQSFQKSWRFGRVPDTVAFASHAAVRVGRRRAPPRSALGGSRRG
jgi:hypothetical protein